MGRHFQGGSGRRERDGKDKAGGGAKGKLHRRFDFYVLLFFLLSFAGWLWEVALCLAQGHGFVNRGFYTGPYLPIYGVGGILLYLLFRRFTEKPLRIFLLSALLCTALEYFGSWFLEYLWGVRWWDYSGHFLNLNGRVCLAGSAAFGLGGMLFICYALPRLEQLYHGMSARKRTVLCLVLIAVFIVDAAEAAMSPNAGRGISFPAWENGAFTGNYQE